MNGRTLSRAIHSRIPTTIAATMQHRDPGRERERTAASSRDGAGSTNGGGGQRGGPAGDAGRRPARAAPVPADRARPSCGRLPDVSARPILAVPPATGPCRRAAPALAPRRRACGRTPPSSTQRDLAEAWAAAIEAAGLPRRPGRSSRGRGRGRRSGRRCRSGWRPNASSSTSSSPNAGRAGGSARRWPGIARRAGGWSTCSDVWLGGPPLAGRVAAADYRIELARRTPTSPPAAAAARPGRRRPPAARAREGGRFDGRVRPAAAPDRRLASTEVGPPVVLRPGPGSTRTLGTGRPEEVVGGARGPARATLEASIDRP